MGIVGGTPTDASAALVAHRLLSSVMRSNDANDWPGHSLMLSLYDLRGLPLRRLPSNVPCSMIFAAYRDGRNGQTTINCDASRLTIKLPDVRRGH